MKKIKLTQDKTALVDDDDYEYLSQWKWSLQRGYNKYYSARYFDGKYIYMHRLIISAKKGEYVDHIDNNGLNNQKLNLRICTNAQNAYNSRHTHSAKAKYKGVTYGKNYIKAQITMGGRCYNLGRFKTEEDAAVAYDNKARELYGEFANLNFPQRSENI